ncbi:hypothetical protein HBHAL_4168 [Halobacillus halophilus DSM 2266]|uniref:Uncharacterized protein n=1 Tax=Halobacillus halophilus (strain ATCC 35676 / DSM 2266 / JCM 20832 / KCTC 3685 / LMG 17431 / NBRC 102448 / NCIMB 2269) TaxID=866895 RepID=I0JQU0_HALH3|nr:hypothetical protein HBHAL_4168 [Halobacillus halophilus DSM 2266]
MADYLLMKHLFKGLDYIPLAIPIGTINSGSSFFNIG